MGNRQTVSILPAQLARADYAGNAGSQGFNEIFGGPLNLAQADNPKYPWPSTRACSGIFYQRSSVTMSDISRGTSNTLMAGERYVDVTHYFEYIAEALAQFGPLQFHGKIPARERPAMWPPCRY